MKAFLSFTHDIKIYYLTALTLSLCLRTFAEESWDSFNLDPKTVAAKVTRFADANTTVRKVNKFGMTAYCLLHSQINDDRYDIELYSFYDTDFGKKQKQKVTKEVCNYYSSEQQRFIESVKNNGYFPRSCPITPGLYYVKNFILKDAALFSYKWNTIIDQVEKITNDSVKFSCSDSL